MVNYPQAIAKKMRVSRISLVFPLLLLFAIISAVWFQWPVITDSESVQDDFRKFYWMHVYRDSDLFQNDPLSTGSFFELNIGSISIQLERWRPSYSLVIFVGSQLVSPILVNKLIIFPLLALLSYFAFKIGESLGGVTVGVALALFSILVNLSSPSSINVAAGLPRSFSAPVILALIYFLHQGKIWKASVTVVLAATIYFPVALLGIVTIGLSTLGKGKKYWPVTIDRQTLVALLFTIALVLVIVGPARERILGSVGDLEGIYNKETAGGIEDEGAGSGSIYEEGTRLVLFKVWPTIGNAGLATKPYGMWTLSVLTTLALFCATLLSPTKMQNSQVIWIVIISSLLCFVAAWIAYKLTSSFILYFPSRYTRVSIATALIIYVVINLPAIFREIIQIYEGYSKLQVGITLVSVLLISFGIKSALSVGTISQYVGIEDSFQAWVLGSALAMFLIALYFRRFGHPITLSTPHSFSNRIVVLGYICIVGAGIPFVRHYAKPSFLQLDPKQSGLMEFVESLPKSTLIGGYLCALDNVPSIAKRQVVQTCEQLTSSLSTAALENLRAYFADSMSEVEHYCIEADVDYLVVATASFQYTRENHQAFFFEPYNTILLEEIGDRDHFALEHIPEDSKVYQDENFVVMECQDLPEG